MVTPTLPVIRSFEPYSMETLSAALRAAPSAQDDTETILPESISSKHLCLCVQEMDDTHGKNPMANYHLISVPLTKLFGSRSSEHDESVLHRFQQVDSWSEPAFSAGIGLLPSKNDLYVVFHGALVPGDSFLVREHTLTMLKYPISREQSHFKLGPPAETDVMQSRWEMIDPIVVEIDGLIYVLSQFFTTSRSGEESIVFQVYDKSEDMWTVLDSPPFLHYRKKIPYSNSMMHLVIGDKFYVSSCSVSCVFCTKTREWGPCKLFGEEKVEGIDGTWGCSFPFDGNGLVVYEDFLVCITSRWKKDLIAYKVSCDGIVQSGQKLFAGLDNELDKCNGLYLTDLGDGNICLMVTANDILFEFGISPTIKFFLFKVSKSPDGQTLRCSAPGDVWVSTLALEDPVKRIQLPIDIVKAKCYQISSFFAY